MSGPRGGLMAGSADLIDKLIRNQSLANWNTYDFITKNVEKDGLNKELEDAEKSNDIGKIENLSNQINNINNEISTLSPYVEELEKIKPTRISFEDIEINAGTTWLPPKYYNKFIEEVLNMQVASSESSDYGCYTLYKDRMIPPEFYIKNKSYSTNSNTELLYGTNRKTALEIYESVLNLKPIVVSDKIYKDGKETYVINKEETELANNQAEKLKKAFKTWKENNLNDEEKAEIENIYNMKFNCMVERKFNGDILDFPEMNTNIKLYDHQRNGVARMVFGRNTGLAHCVGAGKTNVMIAGIMKFKQLGLANKSMVVVPKPIVEQWEREFLNLYPNANILVPNENDFKKENRMKFLNKIAMGNYDAIILSNEQFQKIPLSKERQQRYLEKDLNNYTDYLNEIKAESDGVEYNKRKSTVKQIETQINKLKERLENLKNETYKDNVLDFEELGIDKLFVDEAHYFKNSFFPTKLNRIAGIQSKYTKRTYDLQLKVKYLNEKTDYKGVYFATGTPITNSIVEAYTMMKFLQEDKLKEIGLNNLDDFVANFCEIKTDYEDKNKYI